MDWGDNTIYTGSKDRAVKVIDSRIRSVVETLEEFHTEEICGVKECLPLLATGGNDNRVCIYDVRKGGALVDNYFHSAAAKALTWITEQRVLVSGGGTIDKKLKFWKDGKSVYQERDTGSQVCSLLHSRNSKEVVSCQGFSLNQIIVWNYEGERQLTIYGHNCRVLYSALSPNGECLATGAGDQNLKVWKLFEKGEPES